MTEREREREIYLLVYSSDGCNCQAWAKSKPEAKNFLQVSHLLVGVQTLGLSSAASPGTLIGNGLKVEQPGHKAGPIWDASIVVLLAMPQSWPHSFLSYEGASSSYRILLPGIKRMVLGGNWLEMRGEEDSRVLGLTNRNKNEDTGKEHSMGPGYEVLAKCCGLPKRMIRHCLPKSLKLLM